MKFFNSNKIELQELMKPAGAPDFNPKKAIDEIRNAITLNDTPFSFNNIFMQMRSDQSDLYHQMLQRVQQAILETN